MKIAQRIVFLSAILVAVSYFLYALGFSTGWALGTPEMFGPFYAEAQAANKLLFQWALYGVVFASLSLVAASHKKRRYTVINYGFAILTVYAMIQAGAITTPICLNLEASFAQINPLFVELITAINFSENPTLVFSLGKVFSVVLFVQSGLILLFLVLRIVQRWISAKAKQHYLAETSHV